MKRCLEHPPRWTARGLVVALLSILILGVVPLRIPGTPIGRPQEASAAPSSNPGSVVFASTRSGNSDIYFMDSTPGSPVRQVTTNPLADQRPHLSPDGKNVVFESNRGNGTDFNIWVISWNDASSSYDETTVRQLTTGTNDRWPKWSPDGTKIVYQSFVPTLGNTNHIFAMNADGTNQICRFNCVSSADDTNPDWSADGSRIVFASIRPPHRSVDSGCTANDREIYVRLSDGSGGSTRLTNTGCSPGFNDTEPTTSRLAFADSEIAFRSDRSGANQIHKMRSNGSGVVQLTSGSDFKSRPHFSANDDPKILYTQILAGSPEVMIMNADGSAPTDLTQFPAAADNSGGFCCEPRPQAIQRENAGGSAPNAPDPKGDPVNVASGNASYAEADLAIATAGPQLGLSRTHNNTDQRERSLGRGWRTNLEEEVKYTSGLSTGGVTWTRATAGTTTTQLSHPASTSRQMGGMTGSRGTRPDSRLPTPPTWSTASIFPDAF